MTLPRSRRSRSFRVSFGLLAAVTLFWAVFALLSGAEELGGGVGGVIRNAPNALPWLVPLAVLWLTLRRPLLGGVIFVGVGVVTVVLFQTYRHPVTFCLISLPYLVSGAVIVAGARR